MVSDETAKKAIPSSATSEIKPKEMTTVEEKDSHSDQQANEEPENIAAELSERTVFITPKVLIKDLLQGFEPSFPIASLDELRVKYILWEPLSHRT